MYLAHRRRIRSLFLIFLILFLALTTRLYKIQIVEGNQYTIKANKMRTQLVPGEEFFRGDIVDRNGCTLLDSCSKTAIVIFPAMLKDQLQVAAELSAIINFPAAKILERLESNKNYYSNNPFILKTGLTAQEEEHLKEHPLTGVYTVPVQSRYGANSLAVHLIGHLNSIDLATWNSLKSQGKTNEGQGGYKQSDFIGVKGLELLYEPYLKGRNPASYLAATVDAKGNLLAGLGFQEISNAAELEKRTNVVLTLDKSIQQIVEKVMDERVRKGAVVVMKPSTGEVVALASRPAFDQNAVSKYVLNENHEAEFINRALEHYYPGSIFKVVIAAAALEEGIVKPDDKFTCGGVYLFSSGLAIPCWQEEGHGELSFTEALAQSCNPVFIELGLKLGRDKIIEYAKRFGVDSDIMIGYNLPNFPSLQIAPHSPAAVGNASIGQQGIMLSPLQVANIFATIANDGVFRQPRITERLETGAGEIIKQWATPQGKQVISKNTARNLQNMLLAATTTGTATKAWIEGSGAAGKTSTAQTGMLANQKEVLNAWFAGYGPVHEPAYVVVVMVEDGSTGGKDAAPVFKEILEQIMANDKHLP